VQSSQGADSPLLQARDAKSVGTTEDRIAAADETDIVTDRKAATPRTPAILNDPVRNRGVAFSAEERDELGLTGRLPPAVLTLGEQAERAFIQLRSAPSNITRKLYLEQLHDRNEMLYFKVLWDHPTELLPVVSDLMAGEALGQCFQEYYSPGGIYLSINRPDDIERSFATLGLGADDIDVSVCSDAEEIPGIGDRGVGGIQLAVAKLAIYAAAAGIRPARVIPVSLDVGTDNEALHRDPHYLGNRHARRRGSEYDAFIKRYVETASRLFPGALMHFGAFGPENSRKILQAYRPGYRVFNDDSQGIGTVVLAAVYAGVRVTGIPMKHQTVVIFGAGATNVAIADQLHEAIVADGATDEQARSQIWLVGRQGLLFDDMDHLRDFQRGCARKRAGSPWASRPAPVRLTETIDEAAPTILLGASAVEVAFTRQIIEAMCRVTRRPLIIPVSGPASTAEAMPHDVTAWSDAQALVATGSTVTIGQASSVLVVPGLGLGVTVSRASRVTPHMLRAAAAAIAEQADVSQAGSPLLPAARDCAQQRRWWPRPSYAPRWPTESLSAIPRT
jgi:malate dehydrogenase (oxaloacetate-decarboxylating)